MKHSIRHLLVLFVLLSGSAAIAQSSATTSNLGGYIKSPELNVDTYIAFAKAIKADGRFTIDSACIPALVFHMRQHDGTAIEATQWETIAAIAKTNGLAHFELLQNYSDEKFMQDCSEKRTR